MSIHAFPILVLYSCVLLPIIFGFTTTSPLGTHHRKSNDVAVTIIRRQARLENVKKKDVIGFLHSDDDRVNCSDGRLQQQQQRQRRDFLQQAILIIPCTTANLVLLCSSNNVPSSLAASTASATAKLRPDDAYASLVAARNELQYASLTYLPTSDWEGMRTYFTTRAINMNNYENSATSLLESKRLDAESKREIGTIRRYGVGADVIIMYGGLKNELNGHVNESYNDIDEDDDDEENNDGMGEGSSRVTSGSEVIKYLRRTADSLDEVLAICRSNGF